MKTVNVKAVFETEHDSNLDLFTLVLKVRYQINDSIGFLKSKAIEKVILLDDPINEFVSFLKINLTKTKAKEYVKDMVTNDICQRLEKFFDEDPQETMQRIINVLNQADYNFEFDLDQAEQIIGESKGEEKASC